MYKYLCRMVLPIKINSTVEYAFGTQFSNISVKSKQADICILFLKQTTFFFF